MGYLICILSIQLNGERVVLIAKAFICNYIQVDYLAYLKIEVYMGLFSIQNL